MSQTGRTRGSDFRRPYFSSRKRKGRMRLAGSVHCGPTQPHEFPGGQPPTLLAYLATRRVPRWKSAMQSEWICKRAADALVVGAPGLQTLARLEFDLILTVRDRP